MKINHGLLPNFLGIGGARCGSTWLYANLQQHNDVWLPPVKELHYFDRDPGYPSPSRLAEANPVRRLLGVGHHNQAYRRFMAGRILGNLRHPNAETISWDWRYLFGRYGDSWYASLFKQGGSQIKGEITPAYSILNTDDVCRIQALMPQIKIVFLMRNPVERAWSSIRKNHSATSSIAEMVTQLDSEALLARSDFLHTLSVWRGQFPAEQFFVGFFDDIQDRPEQFLLEIFDFLGVKASNDFPDQLARRKINASPESPMPTEVKTYLTRKYIGCIAELARQFPGHPKRWLTEAEATLADTAHISRAL
jgi:hypothetical protein